MPTRRHLHLLIALLLPLMVLRAMLPPGYMPVAQPDGARLVLCSAGLVVATDDGSPLAPHGATSDSCVFAHAAAAAPPPVALHVAVALVAPTLLPASTRHPDAASPLRRAQSPRGPPIYA